MGRVLLVDAATGAVRDLQIEAIFARFLPTGHLIYVTREGTLSAVPFDLERGETYGAPVALLQDVTIGGSNAAAIAVSDGGMLLYATGYYVR